VLLLGVTLALYGAFEDVDAEQARLVVILGGLLPVPIYCLNVLNDVAVLQLAVATASLASFSAVQRALLVHLFLELHRYGVLVNEVFWGLWLFPFGRLLVKSAAFPRLLGWALYLNGAAYLALAMSGILFPDTAATVSRVLAPAMMGEVLVMLWFVVRGANPSSEFGRPSGRLAFFQRR